VNLADAGKEIKKELSKDEKVLQSVFKIETYYKKYRYLIWTLAIGVVLFFLGRAYMQNLHHENLLKANEAFLALQTHSEDKEALALLQEKNPKLYELYRYAQAVKKEEIAVLKELSTSHNSVVSDISMYAASVLEKEPKDSIFYAQMAQFQQAYLAMKAGNIEEAKQKLAGIEENSPLSMFASLLKHAMIKAK